VVTSPVHSGSYALLGTPSSSDDAQCSQTVSVQPGSSYTLSAWVEGSYVYLGDTGTGTSDTSNWTSSSSWTQLSTTFTTGASTTSVTIWLHGWYGQGNYSADDVSLTGPAGASSTPHVDLTLDADDLDLAVFVADHHAADSTAPRPRRPRRPARPRQPAAAWART
jgi:hypothetical protein